MEKTVRIQIDSKYGHHEVFESNAILGAFITEQRHNGADVSQFMLGSMNEKDIATMMSGIINNFFVAGFDTLTIIKIVTTALHTAQRKHTEEKESQFPWM